MSSELSISLSTLKALDPERYLACLYLPEPFRDEIATLWAFDAEIARIPSLVSEPMPGEIRLQWWRDLLASGNNTGSGPLARRLVEVIGKHQLPLETFQNYLDARAFDLYNDPMPDIASLEGYLGETVSVWFQMSAICTGLERSTELADACGHAGMAVGLSRILADSARHRARQQSFLPLETIDAHDLTREEWLNNPPGDAHFAVVRQIIDLARHHEKEARTAISSLPTKARAVFLPLALVDPLLKQVGNASHLLFSQPVSLSPLSRYWYLLRAAWRR